MIRGQLIPALIAALVLEGVDPLIVERAVSRVRTLPLGASISDNNPTIRAFAFEQTDLLERTL